MEELTFSDRFYHHNHIPPTPINHILFSFENNVTHLLESWKKEKEM